MMEVIPPDEAGGEDAKNILAADGQPQPKRSGYLADVLRMLEEGQWHADASDDLRELSQHLEAHAKQNKGQAKGQLVITLDLKVGNHVLVITPKHVVKKPVEKREGTPIFLGENGSLGINPPGQGAMFGNRPVRDNYLPGSDEVRDI